VKHRGHRENHVFKGTALPQAFALPCLATLRRCVSLLYNLWFHAAALRRGENQKKNPILGVLLHAGIGVEKVVHTISSRFS